MGLARLMAIPADPHALKMSFAMSSYIELNRMLIINTAYRAITDAFIYYRDRLLLFALLHQRF